MKPYQKIIGTAIVAMILATGCGKRAPDPALALADGETALKAKDYRKALVQLKNVVQAQPENGKARFLLAEASYAIRDLASARKEYDRAYDLGYNRDETSLRLAELMQEAGDNKLFVDKFSEYQSQNVAVQSEIISQVGRARYTLGDVEGAKKDFQRALGINPNEKLAQLGMVRVQAGSGDLKGALKAVDQIIEKSPDYSLAWISRSELMRAFSDISGSISAMEKAAQIKPDDLTIQANLASMYLNVGRSDAADKSLEILRTKAPSNLPAYHYLNALRHFQRGNLQASQEAISIALKLQPEAIPFVLLAATIESAAGNFEQAEKHATFVISRSSDKNYARALLASAYLRAQKGNQALELLEPMIKEGVREANIYALAGEAAALQQDLKGAEKYFAMAAKLAPDDPAQKSRLALAKIGLGDTDRAVADLEAAVRVESPSQYSDILLIMAYLRKKEFDKALAAIAVFEKKQPTNVLTHNLRATAYLGKRDAASARAALEAGLLKKPDSVSMVQNLARIDVLEGKKEAAAKRLEGYVAKFPSDPQGLLALAQYKEQASAPTAEVLALYERAQLAAGRSTMPALALSEYLVRLGDSSKALVVLRDAVQKNSDDANLLQRYGALQVNAGDGQGAIATFSKLTKLQPHIALSWMQLAEGYVLAKNDSGAIQSLNRALEIKPTPPQARVMLAQIAHRQGNKAEAARLAEELTRESPTSPTGPMLAADFAILNKDWNTAANEYKKALTIAPRNGAIAGRLHNALGLANQGAAAAALSAQFQKDAPNDVTFLTYLADVELRAGRCAQAMPYYRRVVERDSNSVMVLNNLAWCAHETKSTEALGLAERALRIAPRAPAVMDTLGVILSDKGEHDRAIKLLTSATLAAPKSAELKLHLAQAYSKAGQKEKARAEADAALKMPSSEALQTKIRQLMSTI